MSKGFWSQSAYLRPIKIRRPRERNELNEKRTKFTYEEHYSLNQIANVRTRVIVGGGDGTVMWVVQEMHKYKLDFEKCPLGTIPFGTGNDFSRVLGWGGKVCHFQ